VSDYSSLFLSSPFPCPWRTPGAPCSGLAAQLEDVDPSLLAHHQRLAFWINIHNCLLLHVRAPDPVVVVASTVLRYTVLLYTAVQVQYTILHCSPDAAKGSLSGSFFFSELFPL